jgi:hypothetical protein
VANEKWNWPKSAKKVKEFKRTGDDKATWSCLEKHDDKLSKDCQEVHAKGDAKFKK